jgi:hypothetical protein
MAVLAGCSHGLPLFEGRRRLQEEAEVEVEEEVVVEEEEAEAVSGA